MRLTGSNPVDLLVGSRIRYFRRRCKMSQTQLGDALGVTFQQVQKYENGKNRVGASRLQMVSTALGVPVAEFFGDGSTRTPTVKPTAFDPQALRFAEAFIPAYRQGFAHLHSRDGRGDGSKVGLLVKYSFPLPEFGLALVSRNARQK